MTGNVIQPNGSGGGEVYSTSETVIGTWNGRTLYRKCYEVSAMPNNTTLLVPHGLGNSVSFFSCYGWIHAAHLDPTSFTVGSYANLTTGKFFRTYISGDSIAVETNADYHASGGTLIVEYVKI